LLLILIATRYDIHHNLGSGSDNSAASGSGCAGAVPVPSKFQGLPHPDPLIFLLIRIQILPSNKIIKKNFVFVSIATSKYGTLLSLVPWKRTYLRKVIVRWHIECQTNTILNETEEMSVCTMIHINSGNLLLLQPAGGEVLPGRVEEPVLLLLLPLQLQDGVAPHFHLCLHLLDPENLSDILGRVAASNTINFWKLDPHSHGS
jgi:hypothetical protein